MSETIEGKSKQLLENFKSGKKKIKHDASVLATHGKDSSTLPKQCPFRI